jgi:AhpD family alkylhydroperoxidase
MPRITVPTRDEAPAESQPILDTVGKQLGFIPNLHRLMSLSPAALTGLVGLQDPLSKTLELRTRDAISLAVSEANACNYCLAAHSYRASRFAHESPEEIALNRQGRSSDPKREAAASFARNLIETRGKVRDSDQRKCTVAKWLLT